MSDDKVFVLTERARAHAEAKVLSGLWYCRRCNKKLLVGQRIISRAGNYNSAVVTTRRRYYHEECWFNYGKEGFLGPREEGEKIRA